MSSAAVAYRSVTCDSTSHEQNERLKAKVKKLTRRVEELECSIGDEHVPISGVTTPAEATPRPPFVVTYNGAPMALAITRDSTSQYCEEDFTVAIQSLNADGKVDDGEALQPSSAASAPSLPSGEGGNAVVVPVSVPTPSHRINHVATQTDEVDAGPTRWQKSTEFVVDTMGPSDGHEAGGGSIDVGRPGISTTPSHASAVLSPKGALAASRAVDSPSAEGMAAVPTEGGELDSGANSAANAVADAAGVPRTVLTRRRSSFRWAAYDTNDPVTSRCPFSRSQSSCALPVLRLVSMFWCWLPRSVMVRFLEIECRHLGSSFYFPVVCPVPRRLLRSGSDFKCR